MYLRGLISTKTGAPLHMSTTRTPFFLPLHLFCAFAGKCIAAWCWFPAAAVYPHCLDWDAKLSSWSNRGERFLVTWWVRDSRELVGSAESTHTVVRIEFRHQNFHQNSKCSLTWVCNACLVSICRFNMIALSQGFRNYWATPPEFYRSFHSNFSIETPTQHLRYSAELK